jgi:hypothetical protein
MKSLFKINILTLFLFLLGILIKKSTGVSEIQLLAVLPIIFFLPIYNISFLIFPYLEPIDKIVLSLISSFPIIGLISDLVYSSSESILNIKIAILIFWFVSFIIGLIGLKTQNNNLSKNNNYKPLYWSLIVAFSILVIIFIIYPFIPEADPYTYIAIVKNILNQSPRALNISRPLFALTLSAISSISNTDIGLISKFILPLFGLNIILPIYLIARKTLKNNWLIFLATILPITAPVVLTESVITRTQVAILFTLPGILYLLGKSLKERLYWLNSFLLLISLILFKFHELALFTILVTLITLIINLFPEIKKSPKVSLAFAILGVIAIHPYLVSSGILANFNSYTNYFISRIWPLHFRLWFISHYTNADGTQIGWPGLSWIEYYGYNLGALIPFLLIFIFVLKQWSKNIFTKDNLPAITSFTLYLGIAEILPRFNIAYLPDRAWPFLILSLALLIPSLLYRLEQILTKNGFVIIISCLIIISFGATIYLNYSKQGWVSQNEYEAAQFIKNNTPKDSIVISQGGNGPLINYYANRTFSPQPNIFSAKINNDRKITDITNTSKNIANHQLLTNQKETLVSQFNSINLSGLAQQKELDQVKNERNILYQQITSINNAFQIKPIHPVSISSPIYILYSKDKFNNLYGTRLWWREFNSYNADLELFNSDNFKLIYSRDNVDIWKVEL